MHYFVHTFVRDTVNPPCPYVNPNKKEVNSAWLSDERDERSVLGHTRIHKGKLKDDHPEIATAHNPKVLDESIALLEKI